MEDKYIWLKVSIPLQWKLHQGERHLTSHTQTLQLIGWIGIGTNSVKVSPGKISLLFTWISKGADIRGLTEESTQFGIISPIGYSKALIGDI